MSGGYKRDWDWRGVSESLLSTQVVDKTMQMTLMVSVSVLLYMLLSLIE